MGGWGDSTAMERPGMGSLHVIHVSPGESLCVQTPSVACSQDIGSRQGQLWAPAKGPDCLSPWHWQRLPGGGRLP